jgi:hypothetical protein
MSARPLMLVLALASCGGQSSTQPASTDPATPRPVRIESDEATSAPVRIAPTGEAVVPPSSDPALTSDELADPPPVEPP